MKGQKNLTRSNLGHGYRHYFTSAPVRHEVKATDRNLHSSLKFMLDQANKEVAAVLQC